MKYQRHAGTRGRSSKEAGPRVLPSRRKPRVLVSVGLAFLGLWAFGTIFTFTEFLDTNDNESVNQAVLGSSAGEAHEEGSDAALDVEKELYEEDIDEIDEDGEQDG
eukprot:1195970-Prorocentrum_minimum.AAC.6